jgi:hypothetical protein
MNIKQLRLSFFAGLLFFRALVAQSGLTVTTTSIAAETPAVYMFSFQCDKPIGPAAALGVVFPAGFDLAKVLLADSRTMDGGMAVRVHGDTVWAQRSGRGQAILAGTKVDLILAAVVPAQPGDGSVEFEVLHKEADGLQSRNRQRVDLVLRKSDRL